jgi:hypothetical protein
LIIHLTDNEIFIYLFIYFFVTIYICFRSLPEDDAFDIAVLLTPIALAALVKLGYSVSSWVFIFLTTTATPLKDIAAADILTFVSSESLIPKRLLDILSLSSLDNILPVAAKDKLFLVSLLTSRSFL